jgi:deazaflavin-dependent oxidoreductase (nitroreductase family)
MEPQCPDAVARAFNSIGGSLMARSGRVGIPGTSVGIPGTSGARTGLARRAPIGFVTRADGTILLGSSSPVNRGWMANLKAIPSCAFAIKGQEGRYLAHLVGPAERDAALAELKAKMGGTAERTSWGDLFVLEPEV